MARKRGRPAKDTIQTSVYLDREALGRVEMYLLDPVKGKLKYGALSTLLSRLLTDFVTQVEASERDPVEIFRAYGIELITENEEPNATP
jgi:hypothetical protein